MKLRRPAGASAMILGGLIVLAMAGLASLAIANYVEWENAADAIRTIASVTLPPALGGAALIAMGRWVYGWREGAPLRRAAGPAVAILGVVVAGIFSAELAQVLLAGVTTDNDTGRAVLGAGAFLGFAFVFLGWRIQTKPDAASEAA